MAKLIGGRIESNIQETFRPILKRTVVEGAAIVSRFQPHALEIEIGRVVETDGSHRFVADTSLGYGTYTTETRDPLQDVRKVANEKGLALEPGLHKEEVGRNYYIVVKKE